jgi:ribosomal protein S18 acetylase RimI-like enzyme
MTIRRAVATDNTALLNLARQTPAGGPLRVYADQSPDFFAYLALAGDDTVLWAAEAAGRLEGVLAETYQRVRCDGRLVNLVTLREFKTAPGARSAVGLRLLSHICANPEARPRDLGVGYVLSGNTRAKRFYQAWLGRRYGLLDYGTVHAAVILPRGRCRPVAGYRLRSARAEDLPAIAALLQSTYRNYDLAPEFSLPWLQQQLTRTPSLQVGDFRVVEHRQALVACAAFWDQSSLRRWVVRGLGRRLRLLLRLLRAVQAVRRLPVTPLAGGSLELCHARFLGAADGHREALGLILREQLVVLKRQARWHGLVTAFHASDPLRACVAGLVRFPFTADVVLAPLSPGVSLPPPGSPPPRPVYIDMAVA